LKPPEWGSMLIGVNQYNAPEFCRKELGDCI
jgi:hypothetical protein